MTTGIIVQARMGSSRLPGKVLADLAGAPAIVRLFERLNRVGGASTLIMATSDLPKDDPLAVVASGIPGVHVWRGSENDVLKRFADAARHFRLDAIVRITGDCPLTEPSLIDAVIDLFGTNGKYALADNVEPRTFPHGYDVQVFSRFALETADHEASLAYDREHVMPFVVARPDRFPTGHLISSRTPCPEIRITLDYPEDLTVIRGIYERLYPSNHGFGFNEIVALRTREPDLFEINAAHRQF
jgi:spore coat polysaccharide biosynthesis protein SpsF